MARIIVAGATGTVGRRLVEDLINAGNVVIAIARNEEPLQSLRPLADQERLQLTACDLADSEATATLAEEIADVAALVHVANGPPDSDQDHRSCTAQVFLTINLIAFFGATIKRAVIGSCTSVLGDEDKGCMSTLGQNMPTTYHGSSLQATEKLWNLYAVDSGRPVTFVRFAPSMIGKGEGLDREARGAGGGTDVATIMAKALERAEGGLITLNPEGAIR